MRKELIIKLEEGVASDDVLAYSRTISGDIRAYKSLLSDEKYLGKSLDDELTDEELEEIKERNKLDEQIDQLLATFNEKRKAAQVKLADELKQNLLKKKAILKEFEELVKEEENIGASFNKRKEIQEKWASVGRVPSDKFDDIQSEYSRLNDEFNYNINLYKAIKEHDLKRNFSLKNQVIFQLNELLKEVSVKKIQDELNVLMSQWDEIGPTFQEEWERLKDIYWEGVKQVRQKINVYYEDKRKDQEVNLEKKKALVEKVKAVVEVKPADIKSWNEQTEQLLSLQKEWKKAGSVPKEKNEEVWRSFRAVFDEFFESKKNYFDSLKEESKKLVDKKKALIAKAEELKNSQDWKQTTNELIRLQKDWKNIGYAGKIDQKLWKQFRAACDHFFNAKQNFFDSIKKEEQANLEEKKKLVEEIKAFKAGGDKKEVLNQLKEFSSRFSSIGNVPFKEKDATYKAYKSALDSHYDKLKINKSERESINFKSQLSGILESDNSDKLIQSEKNKLKQQIKALKNEILDFENKLGFFGIASGADAMIKDLKDKISDNKSQIESIKSKIKFITAEANKVESANKEEE